MADVARTSTHALSVENNNMENCNKAVETKVKIAPIQKQETKSTRKTNNRNRNSLHQKKTKAKTVEFPEKGAVKSVANDSNQSDINPMEESETIRKWFTNLPSGAARSGAAVINDGKFIKHYLELCKQYQWKVSRDLFSSENGDAVINAIISGEDSGYCKETSVESKPFYNFEIPGFELSNKDNAIVYESISSSFDKSERKDSYSNDTDAQDEAVTTLYFQSGNELTLSNKKPREVNSDMLRTKMENNQSRKAESYGLEASTEASFIIAETTFTIPKVKDPTKRDIVAAKIQASKALASRVKTQNDESDNRLEQKKTAESRRPDQNSWLAIQSLEILHRQSRVASTKMAESLESMLKSSNKEKFFEKMPLDILCLDPEFLSVENGQKLYSLADQIIRQHNPQPPSGFLTTSPSNKDYDDIIHKGKWPSWVYGCITRKNSSGQDVSLKVPFDVALLAKLEIAIMRSFYSKVKSKEIEVIDSEERTFESKIVSKGELSTIFRIAKKMRQLGEKLGLERCKSFFSSSISTPSERNCKVMTASSTRVVEKILEGFLLENLLLIPIPLLQSYILYGVENKLQNTLASAVEYMMNQFHAIATEANKISIQEALLNAQNNNSSCGGSNGNKSKSRKKKKSKKKKKKNSTSKPVENQQTQVTKTDSTKQSSTSTKSSPESDDKTTAIDEKPAKDKSVLSVTSDNTNESKKSSLVKKASSVDVTVVNGSSAVVVEQLNPNNVDSQNDESWSKVENKSRGSRARNAQKQTIENSTNISSTQSKSGKVKSGRSSASRKRVAHRRIVKDILSTIFQGVEEEISRRRKLEMRAMHEERRRKEEKKKESFVKSGERPASLRDVLIRNGATPTMGKKLSINSNAGPVSATLQNRIRESVNKDSERQCTKTSKPPLRHHKHHNADQNTAPTLSETLSGVSAISHSNNSAATAEDQQQETISNDSSDDQPVKNDSVSPPLPTLLSGVRNTHSASSSVASSLEAHGSSEQNVNEKESDVGYHLLSFCARLSTDMTTFMGRRSCALDIRRRERGALLGALQDIASKMFVTRCHAEMYGSCATQLDLPSSDLDVVICGLPHSKPQRKKKHGEMSDGMDQYPYHGFQSINGGRVLRLAGELERQPWVVQIKPIPTASVPVIKMLADPARLGGIGREIEMDSNGEWLLPPQNSSQAMLQSSRSAHTVPIMKPYPIPWRGADVMNGLISIDITFEGPEHGGLGSTAYSTQVVQDACKETGLAAESTPAVQAIMILKELLAQRRLNEPFSGGLSSYALLLMVVAIIRERKAIRAEMDLAEKQRKAVSAPALNATTISQSKCEPGTQIESSPLSDNNVSSHKVTSKPTSESTSSNSSWASIAKNVNKVDTGDETNTTKTNNKSDQSIVVKAQSSTVNSTTQNSQGPAQNSKVPVSPSFNFSQGSDDVLEVLCSGEPTAGKLLMHFLLFYGHYFDSRSMLIDVTAEDGRGPFANRPIGGSIDPITGMFTVDPIVVYDPLDGEERRNVARSCYAWQNIRSVFAQCYTTLQHTVERKGRGSVGVGADYGSDTSSLLELLLSF